LVVFGGCLQGSPVEESRGVGGSSGSGGGVNNWSLEVSIQLSAEEGDQVFNNLMPGRLESPGWESGGVENEPYY